MGLVVLCLRGVRGALDDAVVVLSCEVDFARWARKRRLVVMKAVRKMAHARGVALGVFAVVH